MSTTQPPLATSICLEFEGASGLGDLRREHRLVGFAERVRAAPDASFPDMATSPAELTAFYRFLNSPAVTREAVMQPHVRQTMLRCAEARRVVVVHDTTEVEFAGASKREGLGYLRSLTSQGLFLHASLAVSGDGSRRPLGVLAAKTWVRESLGSSRDENGRKKGGGAYHDTAVKESDRWWELINHAEDVLGGVHTTHVFDREGDSYSLIRTLLDNEAQFVTRMARDRVVLDDDGERIGRVSETLVMIEHVLTLEVPVSARRLKTVPKVAAREARLAKLAVGATRVNLAPPHYIDGDPEPLAVNVVYVHEVDAPDRADPIAWVLITSEKIATRDDILAVLELYRIRWLIEEYFRALKQGCALEKRQLDSYDAITIALGIFLPVAWQLLLLRNLPRSAPSELAEGILTPTQIAVLCAVVPGVPAQPTVLQAMRAVAYLGGHFIKRPPGWLVLGRGLAKLLDLESGWQARGRSDRT